MSKEKSLVQPVDTN